MRRSHEHASAIIAAIIMMVLVGGLVAIMTMLAQQASTRSNDASRRVSNNATVQTALTRIAYGFQTNLGSEQDYYRLDQADLAAITERSGSSARVHAAASLTRLPNDFKTTGGVWEHVLAPGHKLRRVMSSGVAVAVPSFVVEEPVVPDANACAATGLSTAACASGNVRSYWQVYRIILQDTTGTTSPVVSVVVRSWLGDRTNGRWSKASYARADLRAGRFADYQQISDGNVFIGKDSTIEGPIHSNGLADGSFSTVHAAPTSAVGSGNQWIYVENGVDCSKGEPSISITKGVIAGPGGAGTVSSACNSRGENGQTISFLRAVNSIDTIRTAANGGQPGTHSFKTGSHTVASSSIREPIDTAWRVVLNGNTMSVRYPDNSPYTTMTLQRSNAFVFDDDVRVHGNVGADLRVTIAASRSGGAATIFLDGNLTKGHPRTTSIGLIAHGDVVFWQTPAQPCLVKRVEAALVASTGGVTIPTKYTTGERQQNAPGCSTPLRIDGTIAGHRPPTMLWSWPAAGGFGPKHAGYYGTRQYGWDTALKNNPPPYFPLTGTWQTVLVSEANMDCLFTDKQFDPECR
ncbi:MAG: hypothetical protein ABI200_01515 [Gaiellales bacterium]